MTNLAIQTIVVLLIVAVDVNGQSRKGACPCSDVQPEGEFQCEQQRKFGKCSDEFMQEGGFCDATCNKCPEECPYEAPEVDLSCGCTNKLPEGGFTCDEQRRFGSCWESWMLAGDYCAASCERCTCVNGVKCANNPPPGNVLCLKQAEFGQCEKAWMIENDFCAISCGRCPSESQADNNKQVTETPPIQLPSIEAETSVPQSLQEFDDIISPLTSLTASPPVALEPEEEEQEPPTLLLAAVQDVIAQGGALDAEVVPDQVLNSLQTVRQTLDNITAPQTETTTECNTTIFETISSTRSLSLLKELVQAAGLEATLDNPSAQLTVFAPNNQAIRKYNQSNPAYESYFSQESGTGFLQSIAGYHIVNASYSSQQLTELPLVETLLGKDIPLLVEVIRQDINLEGVESSAKIIQPDIEVCQSQVHIIDNVLLSASGLVATENLQPAAQLPPSTDCVQKSILKTLMDIPGADTFITALEAVEFDAMPSSPITIFVPEESAFQQAITQLGYSDLSDVVSTDEGQEVLTSILMQHIVAGYFPYDKLAIGAPLISQNGSLLTAEAVGKNIEIVAEGSAAIVVAEDVSETCDVAVHVVDAVLLPFESAPDGSSVPLVASQPLTPLDFEDVNLDECDTLGAVLGSMEQLSLLNTTAIAAGLDLVLNDPSQEITFFAPVNSAFQGLTALLGNSTEEIISNLEHLNAVLAYHAVDGVYTSSALIPGQSYPTLVQDRQGSSLTVTIGEVGSDMIVIGEGSSATIVETDIPACKSVIHLIDIVLLPVAPS